MSHASAPIPANWPLQAPPQDGPLDFLQLGGEYHVTGHVGDRVLDFTARGAAETFRSR